MGDSWTWENDQRMRTMHRENDESRPMLNLRCLVAFQIGDGLRSFEYVSSRLKVDIKA